MDPDMPNRSTLSETFKLAMDKLPPSYAVQWRAKHKALVVQAIEAGLLRLEDALTRYRMSLEEYRSWERTMRKSGMSGLRHGELRRRMTTITRRKRGADVSSAPPEA